MTDSLFSAIDRCNELLRLDFSAEEFAKLAEERSLSAESIEAVSSVFEYLRDKKEQSTIQMLLRTSRLPQKQVKTFDNFDFDVLKGKDIDKLKNLQTLAPIYAHKNIAFIGPPGTGKTHLAQAFGYECCRHRMKTYFIKAAELRDKFTIARRAGREGAFNMIFTSNKNPSDWREIFGENDALLCSLDRLFDSASVFTFRGESFRGKHLENYTLRAEHSASTTQDNPLNH